MPTPVSFVQLTLTLPKRDYSVYRDCVGLLSKMIGKKAPDILGLIVHTLRCRDSRGLAEDYLESVNWPLEVGLNLDRPARARHGKALRRAGLKIPSDPSRN